MSFQQVAGFLGGAKNIFCCGKGGVGKTTTAAALAAGYARQGRRCIVISTDPAHSLADVFNQSIGPSPKQLAPNLYGMELDEELVAKDYMAKVKQNLLQFLPPKLFARMEKQMNLALNAPGTLEAALSERMAELLDSSDWDVMVFDTAPTGHTLRLLAIPEIFTGWVEGLMSARLRAQKLGEAAESMGATARVKLPDNERRDAMVSEMLKRRHHMLHRMHDILTDAALSAFCVILTPESLPIRESRRAIEHLTGLKIKTSLLVVNRIMPGFGSETGEVGTDTRNAGKTEGAGSDTGSEQDNSFLARRRQVEAGYLEEIRKTFHPRIPRLFLPLHESDVRGLDMLLCFFDGQLSV